MPFKRRAVAERRCASFLRATPLRSGEPLGEYLRMSGWIRTGLIDGCANNGLSLRTSSVKTR
eukprot:5544386-Amphidinium_carterae.1